ncbi:MAG: DUF3160 domain-containing protein [Gallionella sp.]|nr:DUF3160 domain-containing protein [Gallionella sp.]
MSRIALSSRMSAGGLLLALAVNVQAGQNIEAGLFDVYQTNRETGRPNLVTPDLLLASYGLIRQQVNTRAETKTMIPEFKALVGGLHRKLAAVKGGEAESLSRDYAILLQAMLTGGLPEKSSEALNKEWQLVQQAGGPAESPLWGTMLDYSQFKPRGRYTQSDEMKRYFIAYRYAGTVNFFAMASQATGVLQARAKQMRQVAFYLSRLIARDAQLLGHYELLQSSMIWEYGPSGDLGVKDMAGATRNFSGSAPGADVLLAYAKKQGRLPQIIDFPLDVAKLNRDEKIPEVALGWRLLPGAQNSNALAVQAVLYPNTQKFNSPCGTLQCVQPRTASMIQGRLSKGYVSAYEVMAWLGSAQAKFRIQQDGEQAFEGYDAAARKAQSSLSADAGLTGAQSAFMRAVFSQTADCDGRQLNGMLGFWTWQQSINMLYTKQVMSPLSKSLSFNPSVQRKGAVLSGTPQFYAELTKLVKLNAEHAQDPAWIKFSEITEHLALLAEGKSPLNDEDEAYLNELDTALLQLTKGRDLPIVVDVQTNPLERRVLEEALGLPEIEELNTARGARFRHYEFKQDMDSRLTNEEWQKQLVNP